MKSEEVKIMPRGDGTGPMGMGAMTGRGAGFCAGFKMPGYINHIAQYKRLRRSRASKGILCGIGCAYLVYRLAKRNRVSK